MEQLSISPYSQPLATAILLSASEFDGFGYLIEVES